MNISEIIANKVRTYRKSKKLNQFEFAEDCGISKETLSLIEREKVNTSMETLMLIASRMGITLPELLSDDFKTEYFVTKS